MQEQQQEDGREFHRDPRDGAQEESEFTLAQIRRAREKLDENVARQLPLEILLRRSVYIASRLVQRAIKPFRLLRQHHQMHERVGVDDQEQGRREREEGDQRQFNAEEG